MIFGQGFDDEAYNVEFKPLESEIDGTVVKVQQNHRVVFGEVSFANQTRRKCVYWEQNQKSWRLGQCLAFGR